VPRLFAKHSPVRTLLVGVISVRSIVLPLALCAAAQGNESLRSHIADSITLNSQVFQFVLSLAETAPVHRIITPPELRLGPLLDNGLLARVYQAKWQEQEVAVTIVHPHRFDRQAVLYVDPACLTLCLPTLPTHANIHVDTCLFVASNLH
jgi:hypothetical protein